MRTFVLSILFMLLVTVAQAADCHVICFTMDNCPPCKTQYPIWNACETASVGTKFTKINKNETKLIKHYRVRFFPTTIVADKDGNEIKRFDGLVSRIKLMAAIRQAE